MEGPKLGVPFLLLSICFTGWHSTNAGSVILEIKNHFLDSPHEIVCKGNLDHGKETFHELRIFRGNVNKHVIVMNATDDGPRWTDAADSNLTNRPTYFLGTPATEEIKVSVMKTLCQDNGTEYRCELFFTSSDGTHNVTSPTDRVQVYGMEHSVTSMSLLPSIQSGGVVEHTLLNFTCEAHDTGTPVVHWYACVGHICSNVTQQAVVLGTTHGTAEHSCVSVQTSSLQYTTKRTPVGKSLTVQCHLYHPGFNSITDTEECAANGTHCAKSQPINVLYPVSATVWPQRVTEREEETVTLNCSTDGNPTPLETRWYKDGIERDSDPELVLRDLKVGDEGTYTCVSYNHLAGVNHTDSDTAAVTVLPKDASTAGPPAPSDHTNGGPSTTGLPESESTSPTKGGLHTTGQSDGPTSTDHGGTGLPYTTGLTSRSAAPGQGSQATAAANKEGNPDARISDPPGGGEESTAAAIALGVLLGIAVVVIAGLLIKKYKSSKVGPNPYSLHRDDTNMSSLNAPATTRGDRYTF